eukprot:SAG22_NODE_1042_length_5883_cov_129.108575_2_plen_70_part_00
MAALRHNPLTLCYCCGSSVLLARRLRFLLLLFLWRLCPSAKLVLDDPCLATIATCSPTLTGRLFRPPTK